MLKLIGNIRPDLAGLFAGADSVSIRYRVRKIPKSSGGFRMLQIPEGALKTVQKNLLTEFLYSLPVSSAAFCSVPKRSIRENAKPHAGMKALYKLDFKDAFPSTTSTMVEWALRESIREIYGKLSSKQLTNLVNALVRFTTYKGALPQGAPTSPYIHNLVCLRLDKRLLLIVAEYGLVYTRYMDDLAFSTKADDIPKSAINLIKRTVLQYGFNVNWNKTKYYRGQAALKSVTGIEVWPENDRYKLSLAKSTIESYRNRVFNAAHDEKIPEGVVFGIIGWVVSIYGEIPTRLRKPFCDFLLNRCETSVVAKYISYYSENSPLRDRLINAYL